MIKPFRLLIIVAVVAVILYVVVAIVMAGNRSDMERKTYNPDNINLGNDPNFKIISHTDTDFTLTNRKVMVFGIPIYAFAEVEDIKLLHAANLMAQYLDNNEDGTVDNQKVLDSLIASNAALFLWKNKTQLDNRIKAQDLGADESIPEWYTQNHTGTYDAAIEEVWHVITNNGYAKAYPSVFGTTGNTTLTRAMDTARGGNFTTIPDQYPAGAWYTYDDETCEYDCMASEYIYWGMSSILGAQKNRLSEIQHEWTLNTKEKVQKTDSALYNLLTDTQYKLPTVLPDGTYKR